MAIGLFSTTAAAKGYRALMYLLPDQDAGFFVAYNLADRHDEGEFQEVFITQFRERFVPARRSVDVASSESASIEQLVGDYLYVRRARTTMESFIAVVNRISVGMGENGALNVVGSSGGRIELMPVGPLRFRRTDGRGMIAFQLPSESGPQRLLMTIDSGFPAVYERVSLAAIYRFRSAGWQVWSSSFFTLPSGGPSRRYGGHVC